jgi:hypothetical protein
VRLLSLTMLTIPSLNSSESESLVERRWRRGLVDDEISLKLKVFGALGID